MKSEHYIYVWKEQGICNSGLPFYIGQRELARHLNISSQLLRYRIKNNIPYNLIVSKSNRKGKDF